MKRYEPCLAAFATVADVHKYVVKAVYVCVCCMENVM